jgi:predicted nucleic acid-binding protein
MPSRRLRKLGSAEGVSDVRSVVIDANVIVSFFVQRDEAQRAAAKALLLEAVDGEITAIIPQFVVFEISYVFQTMYGATGQRLATLIRDVITLPGARVTDDCPWKRILDVWPDPLPSLADAAILALAVTNRYDAVATFDKKLARRVKNAGIGTYW